MDTFPSPSLRACLVCGSGTRHTHQGVDVCRACSIFYRRTTERGKTYICRMGNNACRVERGGAGDGLQCKKCRYDRFVTILEDCRNGGGPIRTRLSPHPTPHGATVNIEEMPTSTIFSLMMEAKEEAELDHFHTGSQSPNLLLPSTSAALPSQSTHRPIIGSIKAAYKTMCEFRRMNEALQSTQGSPLTLNSFTQQSFYKTNNVVLNNAMRALIMASFTFAREAFQEFERLQLTSRWKLIKSFYRTFTFLENAIRTVNHLSQHPSRHLASYCGYWDLEDGEDMFVSSSNGGERCEPTYKALREWIVEHVVSSRKVIQLTKPTEEEFLAIIGVSLWTVQPGADEYSDEVFLLGESYRHKILHELHLLYNVELGMCEYSGRIGSLFNLLLLFQRTSSQAMEKFVNMRLLDDFDDSDFACKIENTQEESSQGT